MKQAEIGRKLARGVSPGKIPDASNVRCLSAEYDRTYDAVLLSYNWAVIFGRREDNGKIVEFTGWRGYSPSTSTQMGKIRRGVEDVVGDGGFMQDNTQPRWKSNRLVWD